MPAAVNKDTITRGLRYSVATGNWGQQGTAGMRAGVSQARSSARRLSIIELKHQDSRSTNLECCLGSVGPSRTLKHCK